MKRKRKFYFKKITTLIDYEMSENILDANYNYKTLNNVFIAKEIINLFNKNKIDLKKLKNWFFDDFNYCWIEIKSTREDYFRLVVDFMDIFDGYMEDYKFYNTKE